MPRRLAVDVLERMERTGCLVAQAGADQARLRRLEPEDRRLYWEIVHGVVRHRVTIDHLLATFANLKKNRVHPRVLQALRIAVYQMIYLDRVPPAAAACESVEIVKRTLPPPISGFTNACLRSISRELDMKVGGTLRDEDLTRAVPIPGGMHRLLASPAFPDPEDDPAGSLALRHAHPRWLVERWLDRHGEAVTLELLHAGNDPAALWLRPSPGRMADLSRELRIRSIPFETTESPAEAIRLLAPAGPVHDLPGFRAGWFVVQDRTAMYAAVRLAPEPGDRILDLCAAPGGKATHLAQIGGPEATVVALDRDSRRLKRIEETRRRLDLTNLSIVKGDATDPGLDLGGPFDRVLADVPCSNTGVLSKRVEARHRVTAAAIDELSRAQLRILEAAVRRVRPGGMLVYSTCSVLEEENRALVEELLESGRPLELVADQVYLPVAGYADGGYVAELRRTR